MRSDLVADCDRIINCQAMGTRTSMKLQICVPTYELITEVVSFRMGINACLTLPVRSASASVRLGEPKARREACLPAGRRDEQAGGRQALRLSHPMGWLNAMRTYSS